MDASRSQHAAGAKTARTALPQENSLRGSTQPSKPSTSRKSSGYGLPCSKCRLYYPADLNACPTCHSADRVSPIIAGLAPKLNEPEAEPAPDSALLEQEREEFLRQFKSQLFAAHAEVVNAPAAICCLGDHPSGEPENAEVCKNCHSRLQERLDVCEAALHLDLNEAAQIIYDAVWADPSDPSKTYSNAAAALLGELRKRAGISSLLGPFQTLSH
jgi:RNA polymerase subunit RPABC4/transcription elongation factor Spt4